MKKDYGYFGSGTEGYIHYKQTFDSAFAQDDNNDSDALDLMDDSATDTSFDDFGESDFDL